MKQVFNKLKQNWEKTGVLVLGIIFILGILLQAELGPNGLISLFSSTDDYDNCEYSGQPIDRCEVSSTIIGGYTFEIVKKYGSYGAGKQPNDLLETHLRILEVAVEPSGGLAHKTTFELSGNKVFSSHSNLSDGDLVFIEEAGDFKKLKLYDIVGIGSSIIAFEYWSGGICCNTSHVLVLDNEKFQVLPESILSELKTK